MNGIVKFYFTKRFMLLYPAIAAALYILFSIQMYTYSPVSSRSEVSSLELSRQYMENITVNQIKKLSIVKLMDFVKPETRIYQDIRETYLMLAEMINDNNNLDSVYLYFPGHLILSSEGVNFLDIEKTSKELFRNLPLENIGIANGVQWLESRKLATRNVEVISMTRSLTTEYSALKGYLILNVKPDYFERSLSSVEPKSKYSSSSLITINALMAFLVLASIGAALFRIFRIGQAEPITALSEPPLSEAVSGQDPGDSKDQDMQNYSELIKKVIQYTENHLEYASLKTVADHLDKNPSYLSRLFKHEVQMSYTDYLIEKKLALAKIMLNNKNSNIDDICQKLGYGDRRYFTKLFKKKFGVTPAEFKDGHLSNDVRE